MSTVLRASKTDPPGLRPGVMHRPRLSAAAAESGVPLALVVAPPGFGKTMLLAEWKEIDPRPFAWVSLDRRDNDPLILWNYVVAAIRRIEPAFASELDPVLSSAGGMALDAVVPRIVDEIESLESEIVIVLDDYHWLTSPACHESIALLIDWAPGNLQLVLASRSDPPVPVARVRASGGLFELRATDLAFTEEETAELCSVSGLDLDLGTVATLHRRTEGWPAGLYLAFLSVRDVDDPTAALLEFSGSSRHVVDYLTEVVLESQTESHRSFLLETSILERMCGSLCDSVTRRADSATVLAEIARANLFVVPLDDRREWYRYHHLFGELLSDELRRHSDIEPDLHQRACQWFVSAGSIDEAIEHAILGGDLDMAATLIGTHWVEYLNAGRVSTITNWLERFPREFVRGDARLCIVEAWMSGLAGVAEDARQALMAAETAGYEGELPDGSGTLSESVTLVRASFPWSGVGALLAAASSAYATEASRKSIWHPLAAFDLGYALVLNGDTDEAVAPLEEALSLAAHHEQWMVAGDSLCILTGTALAAGELDQAERWINEALELARRHGFENLPHVGYYHATLGELQARQGLFELADDSFSSGLAAMHGYWDELLVANALLGRALVTRTLGARSEARELLAEARARLEGFPDPGVVSQRVDEVARKLSSAAARSDPDSLLTQRELDVLRLLAGGMTKRKVASNLFLSYSTVHSHTKSIYRKLNANSRDDMLREARARNLITDEAPPAQLVDEP